MERLISKFCKRDESAKHEATRDPIFLVLVETARLSAGDLPDLWELDDDLGLVVRPFEGCCSCHIAPPCGWCEGSSVPTFDEICEVDGHYVTTRVDSVWLTRREAEEYVAARRYRWSDSDTRVRVYCICAEGELAEALRDGSEARKRAPVQEGGAS